MEPQFLLVHGAWHGAWCWELVAPLLEQAGYRLVAPDLPVMCTDPTPLDQVSVEAWAQFVVDVAGGSKQPTILVGHSRAGLIISRAAELAPYRFIGLVYVAAFLAGDGQTLEQLMRQISPGPETAGSLEHSVDGSSSSITPDAVQRVFYNTSPPELVSRARARSSPEPMASFTTPLQVTPERWGMVPRLYIQCSQDRAIAPELQSLMQERLPCERTFLMNTDHSPFYSAPAELSQHLLEIAETLQARSASDHLVGEAQ